MLLTLDPGIRGCGLAACEGLEVVWAGYAKNPTAWGADVSAVRSMALACVGTLPFDPRAVTEVLVEWPQIYTLRKSKGDPNDLLALVGVGSALAALLPWAPARSVRPRAWKGTINGDEMVARIRSLVTSDECHRVWLPCASLAHNVWDAVGLGLWASGRLGRAANRVVNRS